MESFSTDSLKSAISQRFDVTQKKSISYAKWEPEEIEKPVLIIGRGPQLSEHIDAVNQYIEKENPVVVECNYIPQVTPAEEHYSAFLVQSNAQNQHQDALKNGRIVLAGCEIAPANSSQQLHRFNYEVKEGCLQTEETIALPHDVVSMFAVVLSLRFKPSKILFAGFDGYTDERCPEAKRLQGEMEQFFELFQQAYSDISLVAITPTTYPIEQSSIYGPLG